MKLEYVKLAAIPPGSRCGRTQFTNLTRAACRTRRQSWKHFGRKPAPVQASWLGYPNTTGLDTIDYRLTDAIADPEGASEAFYSEKLVRLPRGFLCYGAGPGAPDPGEAPQVGAGHVTFGCFSDLSIVTPHMIAVWAQLIPQL